MYHFYCGQGSFWRTVYSAFSWGIPPLAVASPFLSWCDTCQLSPGCSRTTCVTRPSVHRVSDSASGYWCVRWARLPGRLQHTPDSDSGHVYMQTTSPLTPEWKVEFGWQVQRSIACMPPPDPAWLEICSSMLVHWWWLIDCVCNFKTWRQVGYCIKDPVSVLMRLSFVAHQPITVHCCVVDCGGVVLVGVFFMMSLLTFLCSADFGADDEVFINPEMERRVSAISGTFV